MRAHFSPEIPGGELPVRMNSSNEGGPFGIIELGRSEICLDTVEDARALLAAAARAVAWFETPRGPHAFESMDGAGVPYGSCVHCGRISRSEPHAAAAPAEPLVISDSTIAQAEYFARPGNTIDDERAMAGGTAVNYRLGCGCAISLSAGWPAGTEVECIGHGKTAIEAAASVTA